MRAGTRITFTQIGAPAAHVGHLSSDWKESYWDPRCRYLGKSPAG